MLRSVRLLALLVSLVCILQCSSDKTNQPEPSPSASFLEHTNHGCASGGALDQPAAAHLMDYTANGDTLVLRVKFEANCCPEFREDVDVSSDSIAIVVTDDEYGCRCICPYENEFSFLWPHSGSITLVFQSRYADGVISKFDTLLTISP